MCVFLSFTFFAAQNSRLIQSTDTAPENLKVIQGAGFIPEMPQNPSCCTLLTGTHILPSLPNRQGTFESQSNHSPNQISLTPLEFLLQLIRHINWQSQCSCMFNLFLQISRYSVSLTYKLAWVPYVLETAVIFLPYPDS